MALMTALKTLFRLSRLLSPLKRRDNVLGESVCLSVCLSVRPSVRPSVPLMGTTFRYIFLEEERC